jgi:hypothetical protein
LLKMRAHVIDALDTTGGHVRGALSEKPIFDIRPIRASTPRISSASSKEQVGAVHPTYHLASRWRA